MREIDVPAVSMEFIYLTIKPKCPICCTNGKLAVQYPCVKTYFALICAMSLAPLELVVVLVQKYESNHIFVVRSVDAI